MLVLFGPLQNLAKCDKAMAEDNFLGAFVPRATDVDTMVQLTETAITAGVFSSTGKLLGAIPRANRNDVASGVGSKCATNPQVVKFLQSTYFMLNNTDFMRWDDAYESCESTDIDTWFETQIMGTPNSRDKYSTLLEIFSKKNGVDSLSVLQEAAIQVYRNGVL